MSSPYTSGSASPRVGSSANLSQYASDAPARSPEEEAAERLIAQNTAAAQEKTEPVGNPVYPILAYCGSSIAMTVINKYCVSGAGFSMNFLLLAIQSVVALIAVVIAKRAGIITFRDFDVADAKAWFPISALLVAVIYTGSKSLQGLSIPAYTVLKNGAIILTAYGEVIWFGGHVTSLALCSFLLMIFSSVLSSWPAISYSIGWSDVAIAGRDSQTMGFVWMTLNCFATATYLLTMRKRIKVTGFKDWDSMMYNNLLSIPILLLASILFEDWGAASLARNFPAENRHVLLTAIAISGAAAVFISYSTAWCIRVTSSTTYSMVGALNKLPIAASGMVFFADPVNFSSVGSVLMGFFAGLVYSAAKNQQAKDAKAAASNAIPMYNTDKAKA